MRGTEAGLAQRLLTWAIVLLALMSGWAVQPAPSWAQTGQVLTGVRVEGNQRIEAETVKSYLRLREGEPYDPAKVNDSLKALFATGLFSDVTLRREGSVLVVTVTENPIVNLVAFEGNRKLSDETFEAETQLKARSVYTRTKVQNDVKRILELYRRSGRFAATVEPKIILIDQNRVNVAFEINEGPVTGVRTITFIGNTSYSDAELRSEIATKETAFWRFFSANDNYDPDRLTFDRELLRRYYLSKGYADFRVVSAVAELGTDREDFYITFTLEEGDRYRFGVVDLTTQFEDLDLDEVSGAVRFSEGDRYNADKVTAAIERLTEDVINLGFPFVEVQAIIDRDKENREINVTFDIIEGPRIFVERIEIIGNVRTLDKVIRREFRLVEGDAFSSSRLRRSLQRINNLGFFKKVNDNQVPGSDPDKTILQVEVEEQSTGELSIGAGFSTTEGALGDIGLRERNLLGRGLDLQLKGRISGSGTEFDLSFTDPYFLGMPLAFGVDAFRIERDNQDESSFDLDSIGGGVRIGYEITEFLRQSWRYTARSDDISDVPDDASQFILQQEGTNVTSLINTTLTYDRLDNRALPTEGFLIQVSNEFAGIGGDVTYFRNEVKGETYFPIFRDFGLVFGLKGTGGMISGLGDFVRINNRFFLGGQNLRGFQNAGVGPRDRTTGDALGGRQFFTSTGEFSFPLFGVPEELGLTGRVFTDAGTLTDSEEQGENVSDTGSIRASVGAGVGWFSPFGPIRVDVAKALLDEDFDETQTFHFTFGTRF